MGLSDIVKNISYSVDIRSILDNPDNKLGFYTYANLYNYFVNENGQSYHTLVNSKKSGIREEFCLLMNDVDIILMTIDGYGLDYEIKHDLLTIYTYIKDYQEHPAKIPFIYNLNDLMTLYELDILLKQESIDLFFIELINDILMIEYKLEIVMLDEFKENLRNDIDTYIRNNELNIFDGIAYKKPVIAIEEILGDMNNIKNNNTDNFARYNWVDVKDIAKKIFWNYEFEMAWAEDAWNIIMFNDVVKSDKIVQIKHDDYEYGDINLWLVAMYDLYYEYKVAADYESIDGADLIEYIYNVDNAEHYISTYLNNKIYEELNEQLLNGKAPRCEFYDVESGNFVFSEDSIAFEVLRREIEKRREIIKRRILKYFNYKTIVISEFMEGTHWCENYFNIEAKRKRIIEKYDKILEKVREGNVVRYCIGDSEFEYIDEDEVERDMEAELEELEDECNKFKSDAQQSRVYEWIDNGMNL